MKIYTFLIILILSIALGGAVYKCEQNGKEAERGKANTLALMHKARFYQTSDSTNVASVERLLLTTDELKEGREQDAKIIKDLRIKINRVNSISTTATETTTPLKIQIRDSLIYRAGKTDTIRCVDYQDPYLTIVGCANAGTFSGTIQSRDTIRQIIHRVPRKFWFVKYGTKAIRQEVEAGNPRSKITFSEYIEIQK